MLSGTSNFTAMAIKATINANRDNLTHLAIFGFRLWIHLADLASGNFKFRCLGFAVQSIYSESIHPREMEGEENHSRKNFPCYRCFGFNLPSPGRDDNPFTFLDLQSFCI